MKKTIALLLCVVLIMGTLPVFAAQEDSAKMQEVLLIVKSKIEIPEALSEFSGNVSEYKEKKTYRFEWRISDFDEYLTVTSDDKGRISSYRTSNYESSDKRISDVTKAELIAYAESFLRKTVPEAFRSETDLLVYDDAEYYVSGNLIYYLGFTRQKDGIPVKDNCAEVNLLVRDNKIVLRSMDISYDYDTQFEALKQDMSAYEAKYKEQFPVELIYRDEYNPLAKRNERSFIPMLIYRIKDDEIGYIDSATGEIVTEDPLDDYLYKNAAPSLDSAMGESAKDEAGLTPQEIAELETVAGLLSPEVIAEHARSMPYIDFPTELLLESSNLYKDNLGNYYYSLDYRNVENSTYRYFTIRADAKDGKLLNLSGNSGISYYDYDDEKVLTEEEKQVASQKVSEFLNAVAKDELVASEKTEVNANKYLYSEEYVRIVNGIKYINDGIRVTFDTQADIIERYSLDFSEGEFKDPANAIGDGVAYEKILEYAPVVPMYIRNDGVYKKVFTLKHKNITVDALSGEIKNKETEENYSYSDISGHWAETAATKLAEIQIGLPGGKLEPSQKISQEAFLRLLACAIWGQYYADNSTEDLYESMIRSKILTEAEKAPESPVKREDAFQYVVRMAGYEEIARLHNIFKVTYSDQSALTPEKLGYAAILSGLGVVCGDGGNLRPQDLVTNAEAIVLTYKYLLSF